MNVDPLRPDSDSGSDEPTDRLEWTDAAISAEPAGKRYRRDSSTLTYKEGSTRYYARQLSDTKHSRIGGYRLLEKIGSGGMSVVYKATQLASGRQVALKVVDLKGIRQSDGLAEQIFREASALAAIDHPHVIKCYGFGEDKGRMYMGLELLTGGDATSLIAQRGRCDEHTVLAFGLQIVAGLRAIHDAGFVHRDIKPHNLFLDAGARLKIADLGLAWTGSQSDRESRLLNMGTPSFMPPEQVLGDRELDFRSDIYALGATLYYFAIGRPPFAGEDVMRVLDQVVNQEAPRLADIDPALSSGLSSIVATMMNKQRECRYASLDALEQDLNAVAAGQSPVHADMISRPTIAIQANRGGASSRIRWRHLVPPWSMWLIASNMILVAALLYLLLDERAPVPGATPPDTRTAPPAPPPPTRLSRDLLADQSAWTPRGAVGRVAHKREVHLGGGVLEHPADPALVAALIAADTFTLRLVFTPADDRQGGPARVLSWSSGIATRNLTIGQQGDRIEVRLRTTATTDNGLRPHLLTSAGSLRPIRQVLELVYAAGAYRLWLDGQLIAEQQLGGSLANWDPRMPLLLGDEAGGGFAWRGDIHELVLHNHPPEDAAPRAP